MKPLAASLLALSLSIPFHSLDAQPASRAVGSWVGSLQIGPSQLRIVFNIARDSTGTLGATLDSPDQGARGIPVSSAALAGDSLKLGVLSIRGGYAGRIENGDSVVTGTWTQGGTSFPLTLKRTLKPPAPARPQTPTTPYPYREEAVSYESLSSGIRLAGTLTIPSGKDPFPAVLLISGSGPQDRDETVFGHKPFLVLADYLTRRGVAVLRVDDRGVGGSTGSTAESTIREMTEDVLAGVRFLKGRSEVNPARIGLIGHSEGGLIAPLAAARSKDVAYIGLLASPGLPGDEILLRQTVDVLQSTGTSEADIERTRSLNARVYAAMREESDSAALAQRARAILTEALAAQSPEAQRQAGMQADIDRQVGLITSRWFRTFVVYDPRPALRSVTCPVLVLHGEKDIQVSAGDNQKEILQALAEGGNNRVTASILPGLNHLFQTATTGAIGEYGTIEETIAPKALDAIGTWIAKASR